jgi:tetratricopeptide (TPR) repeat protein
MNFKKLSLWTAAAGLLVLAGCNIFNPNGAEESSCESDNAECYIALGQSLIQQKSFEASMSAYAKAIAIDSSKSEAYLGYATAATFRYKLNLGSILDDLTEAGKGNPTAFTNHSNQELTDRIRMATAVVGVMNRLADRDSLTRWYEYLKDSSKAGGDPQYAQRKAFITAYLAANSGSDSRSEANFPLSDRKKKFENQIFQFAPHFMMYTILNVYDLAPRGEFTDHDRIMMNLLSSQKEGGLGNLTNLADSMATDTLLQNEVNDKILELQSGLGDLSEILAQFNISPTADTGGAPAQNKKQMDSAIQSLGGALVFYQFGDRVDNDGDGCLDEEIVDSLDNDLDGFVDEDARLIDGTGSTTSPGDQLNNDRVGGVDDVSENMVGGLSILYPGSQPYHLVFVAQYLRDNLQDENTSTWVKIKKGSPEMDARIAVQQDSLAVHLTPGQPVPVQYQAKLQNAKNIVGGCWRNY